MELEDDRDFFPHPEREDDNEYLFYVDSAPADSSNVSYTQEIFPIDYFYQERDEIFTSSFGRTQISVLVYTFAYTFIWCLAFN